MDRDGIIRSGTKNLTIRVDQNPVTVKIKSVIGIINPDTIKMTFVVLPDTGSKKCDFVTQQRYWASEGPFESPVIKRIDVVNIEESNLAELPEEENVEEVELPAEEVAAY